MNINCNYNYGIALLKMLMCFEVILIHFWKFPEASFLIPFDMLKSLAVPSFMFLSFYFSAKTFSSIDNNKLKKRIWRIVYPQIGWAIIYWFVLIILQTKVNLNISLSDLFWQTATGHSPKLNPSMWFQTVLIALTFLFIYIFRLRNAKRGLYIISSLAVLSLLLQYSGINLSLFDSLRYELKYPLGRFFEMIPYAALGYIVSYFNVFNRIKLKNRSCMYLFILGILLVLFFKYRLIPSAPGFGYSDNNNMIGILIATTFAYLLPIERISDKIKHFIAFITKYTYGIYCMHRLVALSLGVVLVTLKLELTGFIQCIIIYIIAFIISFLMSKSSSKFLKQLVE